MTTDRRGVRKPLRPPRLGSILLLGAMLGGCALMPTGGPANQNIAGPIPDHVITNPDEVSGKFDHSCGKQECEDSDPIVTKHDVDATTKPGLKAP